MYGVHGDEESVSRYLKIAYSIKFWTEYVYVRKRCLIETAVSIGH